MKHLIENENDSIRRELRLTPSYICMTLGIYISLEKNYVLGLKGKDMYK